jgi:hypothetical protein
MIGNKDYDYWHNYTEQGGVSRAGRVNRLGRKRLGGVLLVFTDP